MHQVEPGRAPVLAPERVLASAGGDGLQVEDQEDVARLRLAGEAASELRSRRLVEQTEVRCEAVEQVGCAERDRGTDQGDRGPNSHEASRSCSDRGSVSRLSLIKSSTLRCSRSPEQ